KVQERNPGFTKEDYAEVFREYLGVTNVLWLKSGIAGDDTHGHVDDLTRFANPSTVVAIVEPEPNYANSAPLQAHLALLQTRHDPLHDATATEHAIGVRVPLAPFFFGGERSESKDCDPINPRRSLPQPQSQIQSSFPREASCSLVYLRREFTGFGSNRTALF